LYFIKQLHYENRVQKWYMETVTMYQEQ